MSKCLECNKETSNPKYCNRSCSAKHNNKNVRRHGLKPGNCAICGTKLKSHINDCCSHACSKKKRKRDFIKRWKSGEVDGLRGKDQTSDYIRQYFFEKYDSKCQKCGWGEDNKFTGKIPLNLHHVNGDWRNNTERNLVLLCPNCHSMTENYGSRNNKGRTVRQNWRSKKQS